MSTFRVFKSVFCGMLFCLITPLFFVSFMMQMGRFFRVIPFLILFFGFVICSKVFTLRIHRNRLLNGILASFLMFIVCNIISVFIFKEKLNITFLVKLVLMLAGGALGACKSIRTKHSSYKKIKGGIVRSD